MLAVSESRILRTLLITSTIAVLICYAWLAARLLEPEFSTPAFVKQTLIRTAGSQVYLFAEKSRQFPREAARLKLELTSFESRIEWLGAFRRPIQIVVDEKQPSRLLATETRIEIGREVLFARGQLRKAVLKSWLLQHAALPVTGSLLRIEVASDVLLAMLEGRFDLSVPAFAKPLGLHPGGLAWWRYADSYAGVCASPWRPLELGELCSNEARRIPDAVATELSFREFLDLRIWESYQALPLKDRLAFVKSWVSSLATAEEPRKAVLQVATQKPPATTPPHWLDIVRGELEVLLPAHMDTLASERASWSEKIDVPLIVMDQSGRISAPGTLKIDSSPAFQITHAKLGMMTVCSSPSVGDVLDLKIQVDRLVWRPGCAERKSDFVQVRPSAIRLALGRGLARRSDKLDQFVLKNQSASAASAALGLANAKWDGHLKAYQVRGAIEAVEIYRLGQNLKTKNESDSYKR